MEKYITGIKAAVAAVVAMMIERDGVRYSEAIDPLDSGRVYTETDEPIDIGTGEAIVQEWDALEAHPLPHSGELAEFERQQAAKEAAAESRHPCNV